METHRQILDDVIELVWGNNVREQLFERWSQGFEFSPDEATALQQYTGGPCAVIAPVQAYLLKNVICHFTMEELKQLSSAAVDGYLAATLTELLCLCGTGAARPPWEDCLEDAQDKEPSEVSNLRLRVVYLNSEAPYPQHLQASQHQDTDHPVVEKDFQSPHSSCDPAWFHYYLRIREFTSGNDLLEYTKNHLSDFKSQYGVLLFLYSALVTRGCTVASLASLAGWRCEGSSGEAAPPLISGDEGHGEQPLLNLLLTGSPTAHVFDGARDVGGIQLSGVWARPTVGLLHLQEHYRQLRVGWYLKHPLHPVWLCASQHHITVIFSPCPDLVCPSTSEVDRAYQVFGWHDTEGNGFIPRERLEPVLRQLGLCTDDDFIKFMWHELDPDDMGVILYHKFKEAFFGEEEHLHAPPDTFVVYHYNGLLAANPGKKVRFAKGYATRQESALSYSSLTDLSACLSTAWGNTDLQWEGGFVPSMN